MKKILVIGNGFLGKSIEIFKSENLDISCISKNNSNVTVDIRNVESLEKTIIKINPQVIINCAALTNIDEIEKNSEEAYEVNAYGAKNIACIASKYNIRLIHISTDSVFDGKKGMYTEKDVPIPINEYAKSKKLGEELVMNNLKNCVIVRTNFYGLNNEKKFLFNWIINNLQNDKKISGFKNIIFSPLEITNLAKMLLELSENNFQGIIHLSSNEPISKFNFIKKIAKILGFNEKNVTEGNIDEMDFAAKRPLDTSLSNSLAKTVLNTKIINLDEWLIQNKSKII